MLFSSILTQTVVGYIFFLFFYFIFNGRAVEQEQKSYLNNALKYKKTQHWYDELQGTLQGYQHNSIYWCFATVLMMHFIYL